ncbi:MAG: hypothetical protein IJF83_00295 [Methanobrevibacter sp.]|nr:hypothetical protein [Methanobrevibacter sp.]
MRFRKEIIIFSLIMIFMLMSAVSAEENITVDDGADSTSDGVDLDSNQGYDENNISENPILDDEVMDDDGNISEGNIKQNTFPGSLNGHGASSGHGFDGIAYASASSNKNIATHKSSSSSHFSETDGADVSDDEGSIDAMLSNFGSSDAVGVDALNDFIPAEDLFEQTYSSYREFLDNLNFDSLENLIEDLMINSPDLNDEMGLFMESDINISDMLIIPDNMGLANQTFELNAPDVSVNSDDRGPDLQLSDDSGRWRDAHDNSDDTVAIPSFKSSQPFNRLSGGVSQDIQHTFYHTIGCECTSPGFTKQHASYDSLLKVSEFDTIASDEQEDNHDCVLFRNVNSPFIVENTSIFALFGVIEVTIP